MFGSFLAIVVVSIILFIYYTNRLSIIQILKGKWDIVDGVITISELDPGNIRNIVVDQNSNIKGFVKTLFESGEYEEGFSSEMMINPTSASVVWKNVLSGKEYICIVNVKFHETILIRDVISGKNILYGTNHKS